YSDTSITITHNPKFRTVEATRGNIISEDGRILSVTMPVYDVRLDLFTVNNSLFEKEVEDLSIRLSQLFKNKSASQYEKLLRDNKDARYFLLKRDVSYIKLQEMKTFSIFKYGKNRGGFIPETKSSRDNPFGSLGKITVGKVIVSKTQHGRDTIVPKNGIELAFNSYLQGIPGKELTQEISGRVLVPKKSEYNVLPQPGKDVITTINIEFQDASDIALRKKMLETKALWGTVILMEVETGDIKAISNLQRDGDYVSTSSTNHAIVSEIAPGSTFKLASFLSVLEDGYVKLSDTVETGNGKIKFHGSTISDTKKGGYGKITFGDAFVVSSNVAISKVINENYKSHPDKFYANLQKFQLTEPLKIQLPYTSNMIIRSPSDKLWSGNTLSSMSIGYEMKLSPIHILTFYNAIANKGKMVIPRLVLSVKTDKGIVKTFPVEEVKTPICSEESINKLLPFMERVISDRRENWTTDKIYGTARSLYTPEYKIAGKTGTCKIEFWKWSEKTKYTRSYTASFVGFFPADNPKYSCIVVVNNFIDTTDKHHYGGDIAGPVFREISDKVFSFDSELEYLSNQSNISEDEIDRVTLEKLEEDLKKDKDRSIEISAELNNGRMPDLRGMKLRDILPVFENLNLKIELVGAGGYVKFTNPEYKPENQEKIKKDELIEITLSW
ncbi:MAG: penicillin-binding transpeptidase domain-containing protein, partial [Flavobacteriales bacterium]